MSAAPIPRLCWAYLIVAGTNDKLKLAISGVSGSPFTTAALTAGSGYTTPDNATTGLGPAIAAAIATATGLTCTFSMTTAGIASFTMSGLSVTPTITWSDAPTVAILTLLGFAGTETWSTESGGSSTLTATNQVQNFWYPGLPVRTDPKERSTYPRAVVETSSGVVAVDLAPTLQRRTISFENLPGWKTLIVDERSSSSPPTVNQALERLFVASSGGYAEFFWWDDATSLSTFKTYALREKTAQQFVAERMFDTLEVYRTTLEMTAT
jgi:hypothetical protein